MRLKTLFFLCLAIVALSGCTRPINRAAERRIRDMLPTVIGQAKKYTAHIDNAPEKTLAGKLSTVLIEGEDVHFRNGLIMDNLKLELKGVEIDVDSKRLKKIRHTNFIITVGEANLNEYLVDEVLDGESLRNVRVKLNENSVTVIGQRVVLGLGVPFEISGPLKINGPTRIELDTARMRVVGLPFTGKILDFVKRRITAATDLDGFAFPMIISEIRTGSGKLTLSGSANPMPLLDNDRPLW